MQGAQRGSAENTCGVEDKETNGVQKSTSRKAHAKSLVMTAALGVESQPVEVVFRSHRLLQNRLSYGCPKHNGLP